MTLYESNSEGEDNPMVSEAINPLLAQVKIIMLHLGAKGVVKVIIDSGCI